MALTKESAYPGGDWLDNSLINPQSASASEEKVTSPVVDKTSTTTSGLFNSFTGLLSKAADTALDVWALKEASKANSTIGTAYPSGQSDPAAAKSNVNAEQLTNAQTNNMQKYMPYIIAGGVAIVVLFGAIAVAGSRKS